jgi:hypothetical protein
LEEKGNGVNTAIRISRKGQQALSRLLPSFLAIYLMGLSVTQDIYAE